MGVISGLFSCTKPSPDGSGDQGTVEKPDKFKEYIFAVKGTEHLKGGEPLMVFTSKSEMPVLSQVIISENTAMLPFTIENTNGITAGDAVYVCTPNANSNDPSKVALSIPSVQKQSGSNYDLSFFPVASEPFIADCTLPTGRKNLAGTIQMNPLYAIARFDICFMQQFDASQEVESVTFSSNGIAGDFTYDLTSSTSEIPTLNINTITTEVEGLQFTSVGSVVSVYMALAPGEHTGDVTVKIGETLLNVSVENVMFERGAIKPVAVFVQGDITGGNEEFNPSEDFAWEE